MRSPDLPFELEGGNDYISALHNRINVLARIKYLTNIELDKKSKEYKLLLDSELFVRYYKDLPQEPPISEEWCQRAAEIIRILEKEEEEVLNKAMELAPQRVEQLYRENKEKIFQEAFDKYSNPQTWAKKESLIVKIFNKMFKKK